MICTGIVLHLIHKLEQIVTIDIPPPLHRLLQHVHLTELKNGGSVADINITRHQYKNYGTDRTYMASRTTYESGYDPIP
jgi:hypothetical protein